MDEIIEIIGKQMNGTATASELQQLEEWLNADPSVNRLEYEEFVKIWTEAGQLTSEFDVRAGWEKVDRRIKAVPTRRMHLPWMAAAAVVALLVTAGLWLFSTKKESLYAVTVTASYDNQAVTLRDGTVVTLRKNAVLSYARTFYDGEANARGARTVQLKGQAFFDIKGDSRFTFTVQTDRSSIRVLGTSFFVNAGPDSVAVIVSTGKVRVSDRENENSFVELSGHESAKLVAHRFVKDTATANYLAWKTGVFDFNNESLDRVVEDLNSYYGETVSLSPGLDPVASTLFINAHFDHETLSRVLEEIQLTTGLVVKKDSTRFVLYHR